MVKGNSFGKWVDTEFPKVYSEIDTNLSVNKVSNVLRGIKEASAEDTDAIVDIISSNKKTLVAIEQFLHVMEISKEHNASEELREMEFKLLDIERRLDSKLATSNKTIAIDFEKRISSITEIVGSNMFDVKQTIGHFKIDIQEERKLFKVWKSDADNKITNLRKRLLVHQNIVEIKELSNNIREYYKEIKNFMEKGEFFENRGFSNSESHNNHNKSMSRKRTLLNHCTEDHNAHVNYKNVEIPLNDSLLAIDSPDINRVIKDNTRNKPKDDLLICIDSNRKHLKWQRMCTLKGTGRKFVGKLNELENIIRNENKIGTLKHILINVGLNDLNNKPVNTVFQEIMNLVKLIRTKYQEIVIIVCEVTPRNDKDTVIQKCNNLIHQYLGKLDHVYVMRPIFVNRSPPPSLSSSSSSSYSGLGQDRFDGISPNRTL